MVPITNDLVSRVISLLADNPEEGIEAQVAGICPDPMTVRRLIDWIPEGCGFVAIRHLDCRPVLPTTFSAKNRNGMWKTFPIEREPVFVITVQIAESLFTRDHSKLQRVAARSSLLNTVKNALSMGVDLNGAVMSGPALISIPAEIYQPYRPHLWKRLFKK